MKNRAAQDELLSDLAVLQELFSLVSDTAQPVEGQAASSDALSRPQPSGCARARRKRTPHRDAAQALKREIAILNKQLRELHRAKEHRKPHADNGRVNWSQQAVMSRIAQQDGHDETRTLKRRIAESAQLVERVKQMLAKQMRVLSGSPKLQRAFLDDETRVLSTLKAALDARYGQMNALVNRSRIQTLALRRLLSPSIREMNLWTPFVHHQGAGVSFGETEVIPFGSKMIQEALAGYAYLDAIMGPSNLVFDQIRRDRKPRVFSSSAAAIDQASGGKELDGRMILRVILNDREILLMWEHAFYWQANEDFQAPAQRVFVRDSGVSLVTPCLVFDGNASIVHWSSSISMNAVDGTVLRPKDPRVRRIAKSCQSWFDVHIRSVENRLMGSKIGVLA